MVCEDHSVPNDQGIHTSELCLETVTEQPVSFQPSMPCTYNFFRGLFLNSAPLISSYEYPSWLHLPRFSITPSSFCWPVNLGTRTQVDLDGSFLLPDRQMDTHPARTHSTATLPHLLGLALCRPMAPSFLLSTAKPLQTLLILPLLHSKLVFTKFRAAALFSSPLFCKGKQTCKANYEICRQEEKTQHRAELHKVQKYINWLVLLLL